ncbi:DUF397 domain-containing protein [Actinomadura rugatobispora]|uniref:DUF397 domain-containing protein n=1 Tax=Actinomadura rugatobispora TaxID=1994 RepID=A0ABW0ZYC0_9ACTN|nr:DUF397 domain-containing protein [Actinomadura rugatobispora]
MRIAWRKSSYSGGNGGDCIEVADLPTTIAIRDSKDPHGPHIHIPHDAFRRFAEAIKSL